MNKDAVIADMKKRQGNAKGDEADALHYAIQKVEHDFDDDGSMKINPYESNAFAQAVQKAKAAGMKKGDKFKVGDKEYTLEDMEKLVLYLILLNISACTSAGKDVEMPFG